APRPRRRDALLRRPRQRRDRGMPRRLARHREARLAVRARVAARPARRTDRHRVSREDLPELFARAVDLDADGRQAFLARLRDAEPALAAELEALLAASAVSEWEVDRLPWEGRAAGDAAVAPEHPER